MTLPPPDPTTRLLGRPAPARYASFGRRLVASAADGSATQAMLLVVRATLAGVLAARFDAMDKMAAFAAADPMAPLEELGPLLAAALAAIALWLGVGAVVHIAYFALQEGSARSATVGKRLVRLTVVDAQTLQPISRRRAAWRTAAKLVSLAPLGLGYVAMLWHPQRRCWHDRLAGTAVIVTRAHAHGTESAVDETSKENPRDTAPARQEKGGKRHRSGR